MRWLSLILILASSLCVAASRCPDPRLRDAKIGGDTIVGSVRFHKKPLRFAKMRLYASSGKIVWVGKTNKDGGFEIHSLQPGDYRLEVDGWGSTTIQLNPQLDKGPFGQVPAWYLLFTDHACIDATVVIN